MKRASLTIVLASSAATAGSLFTWSGTASGTFRSDAFSGADFSLEILVGDVSADLSPLSGIGSYAIQSVSLSIDGGAYEQTLGAFDSAWSSIVIDPGGAGDDQLVGASNLFGGLGGDASFLIGFLLGDADAFADPSDLSGAGSFQSTSPIGTAGSFNSALFDADLDVTGFSYSTNLTLIPLPHATLMAGVGLVGVGSVRRPRR